MRTKSTYIMLCGFLALISAMGCQQSPQKNIEKTVEETPISVKVKHADWVKNASIYEVNIRQFTPEGTINAFRKELPRLKALGVELLWIMPIQPIGEKNRKGSLGSYYSIKDYTAVNPEFGTLEDFKALVKEAHALGLKVILDWVANHTAWDAVWIDQHPDWYTRNDSNEIVSPVEDWSDVADLNYGNKDMRAAMLAALKFWVREADIDGYRCDVAMMVPMDFWNQAREELDDINPVFMLAEAEGPEFHEKAFDMTYGWEFHHLMNQVAKGLEPVSGFTQYAQKQDTTYGEGDIRMYFTTNHDENSWNGTVYERLGENHRNFFILAATFPQGMPLVYSGQEAGLNKRLAFFEKDTIDWTDTSLVEFYKQVLHLHAGHPALANGKAEGDFKVLAEEKGLYAYTRSKAGQTLLVALNFSNSAQRLMLAQQSSGEGFASLLGSGYVKGINGGLEIPAHGHLVLDITK